MAFELDPLFHTETMVKILKDQGHWSLAAKVLEKVLEKSPENPRMISLRESLRNGGREAPEKAERPVLGTSEDEITDPGTPVEVLQASPEDLPAVAESEEQRARREKLEKLNVLLQKIQERS